MPFDGDQLRELRHRRALTLRELGKLSGISFDSIQHIETNQQRPRPSTVRKLAAALDVDPQEFFTDFSSETGKAIA